MPRRGTKTDANQRTSMRPSTRPNPASSSVSLSVSRLFLDEALRRNKDAYGATRCAHSAHLGQHSLGVGHDVDDRRGDDSVEGIVVS